MKEPQLKRVRARAAVYASLYPQLLPIAKRLGYTIAIHGSLSRDMDLVAVPWVEDAATSEELLAALTNRVGVRWYGSPQKKPHGRVAYAIVLDVDYRSSQKSAVYIDISVMHLHRKRP